LTIITQHFGKDGKNSGPDRKEKMCGNSGGGVSTGVGSIGGYDLVSVEGGGALAASTTAKRPAPMVGQSAALDQDPPALRTATSTSNAREHSPAPLTQSP
jgi:hypothetical protein